jgi:hypothetical protein
MIKNYFFTLTFIHFILFVVPLSAAAAAVTSRYDFEAWNFTGSNGGTAPVEHVYGSLSITLDPYIDYGQQYVQDITVGITLHSLNLTLDSQIGFNYSSTFERLNMGGIQDGVDGITYNISNPITNDLWFNFRGMKTNPYFVEMNYVQSGIAESFYSNTGLLTITNVPIPAAAWLFGSGLIGLAGIARAGQKART